MFTSRAEYRLILREDNADRRLSPIGERLGLLDAHAGERVRGKTARVAAEAERLRGVLIPAAERINARLAECESAPISQSIRAMEMLRRPELSYRDVLELAGLETELDLDEAAELEIDVKYDGYVRRQTEAIERFQRLEDMNIPEWVDFHRIRGLSTEVRERLSASRPQSLGQAARMPGITPAAVSILAVHIKAGRERAAATD
jgi:tRNA uridine 5-carboxymethylaminomethyl modification enzyme